MAIVKDALAEFLTIPIPSLPGLVEHFPLRQLPRSKTGSNKEHEHASDHEVLKVVLDQVKSFAGRNPCAVEIKAVGKNQDCRLQSRGGRCHSTDTNDSLESGRLITNHDDIVLHLIVVKYGLMWQGQLWQIGRDAWLSQMSWSVQCRPPWVNLVRKVKKEKSAMKGWEVKKEKSVMKGWRFFPRLHIPCEGAGLRWLLGRRLQGDAWQ